MTTPNTYRLIWRTSDGASEGNWREVQALDGAGAAWQVAAELPRPDGAPAPVLADIYQLDEAGNPVPPAAPVTTLA